jgi:hypothetical protein
VSARSDAYWNDFPVHVRRQLRREPPAFSSLNVWSSRLKLAGAFALALGLMWFGETFHPLRTASDAITRQSQNLRGEFARLQTGLSLVAFNPHGMGYLLAEAN